MKISFCFLAYWFGDSCIRVFCYRFRMKNCSLPIFLTSILAPLLAFGQPTPRSLADGELPVMHACGHDIHMSALIGTARVLGKLKDKWHGTIIFIGQPAEEMVGGARAMLHAGLYDRFGKPAYAVALHDNAEIEAGKIGI